MTTFILYTLIALSATAAILAVILYFVAKKFYVFEDPRIDQAQAELPGANCGACGFAGCRNFAESLVKTDDISKLFCPVGGNDVMKKVATVLGKAAAEKAPTIAVVRCNGTPEFRPRTNIYDGAKTCRIAHNLYMGETGCPNGCLGLGDCTIVCDFDAIYMNAVTGLPEVNDEKCTSCGACVKACPRMIIELRKKNPKARKIFVACINNEKGAICVKNCKVSCIACGKCQKECPHDAITIENDIAFIDSDNCKLCRKCVEVCPTKSILEINFPPRKTKESDASISVEA